MILDDVQQRVASMFECLDNRQGVTQSQVQGVLHKALSLSRQISATVDDIGRESVERQTTLMIQELKAGECLEFLEMNSDYFFIVRAIVYRFIV